MFKKKMRKLKRTGKPRHCVSVCAGKRFVVDVIFGWNYSNSTTRICSTELFRLLRMRFNYELHIQPNWSRAREHPFKAREAKNKQQIRSTYVYFSSKFISSVRRSLFLSGRQKCRTESNRIERKLNILLSIIVVTVQRPVRLFVFPDQICPNSRIS